MDEQLAGPSSAPDEVPLLYSASESEKDEDEVEQPKKRRKQGRIWSFDRKFSTVRSAEEFIKKENTWTVARVHCTTEGVKRFYRCNKVKYRSAIQCSAAVYLLFDASSDDIILFRCEKCHDHDNIESRSTSGLNEVTKSEINKLFEMRLKPKSILKNLSKKEGLIQPTILQLCNYLKILRKQKYGPTVISLGELELWLKTNSQIPDNDHTPFVVAYNISEDDSDPSFQFMISTKYLIGLSRQCAVLHSDATYKLIWQGFPVLIVGTTDKDKHFHPFGLAVTTTEQTRDFVFLFTSLKNAVFSLYSFELTCNVLVCDAAKSIQRAFALVFGPDITIRMCWAHAKKKMQAKVEQCVQKESQKEILEDIDDLQCASTQEVFDRACEHFLDKWKDEKVFKTYFETEWLIQNRYWYLGASPGTPATNNALEAFNKVIKDGGTLRERHPIARFLTVASDMVKDWSNEYVINSGKHIANSPTISLKVWTESYQWAKLPKKVPIKKSTDSVCSYRVPAGTDKECTNYERLWDSFEEYKIQIFSEWEVTLPQNKNDWLNGTCNCPKYLKDYICKHLVGLAIRLKYVEPPAEARTIPIGQKRKRGRPSKAKKALLIQ